MSSKKIVITFSPFSRKEKTGKNIVVLDKCLWNFCLFSKQLYHLFFIMVGAQIATPPVRLPDSSSYKSYFQLLIILPHFNYSVCQVSALD